MRNVMYNPPFFVYTRESSYNINITAYQGFFANFIIEPTLCQKAQNAQRPP